MPARSARLPVHRRLDGGTRLEHAPVVEALAD